MNIIKNTLFKLLKTINYFILSFSLLGIIYISLIIYYLNNLSKCNCFNQLNDNNYSDINFLIFIEYIILILFILLFLISINNFFMLKGGNYSNKYDFLSIFILFFILSINIYILLTILKISQNVNNDCKCTNSWIRYLLYFQGIIILFNTISIILKFIK
jgi:hypothetical protein